MKRIKLREEEIDGWRLIPYIFTDASNAVVGYNFQCVKRGRSGFIEFVRLDLHKKGKVEEDSPHVHLRIESKEVGSLEEAKNIIDETISQIVPEMRGVVG